MMSLELKMMKCLWITVNLSGFASNASSALAPGITLYAIDQRKTAQKWRANTPSCKYIHIAVKCGPRQYEKRDVS